ncbi:PadR family transcriptional regulator [Cytobacillus firmus]|uniref:PadR family transcriptional regulator n=1 Tax=Cytobacillus TaxID=2675230 RepID=UPI00077C535C|nr:MULTISPECIES: PadR family transcriptional regulator [Cytobacillus]MBG9543665.1 PadR family transcriptional regulator [Cytobacillus firmus]MBG9550796.1 PadR family transcriptional regulator [Cytobacillus firmus]MBG9557493.1 PadR family transcriptional regulator [Cytobacillus firmus]MBG9574665.1 PadR family transcriptional regulator [Cytobacillus firmus]MEC1895503.1 PadR family transcriptional regulator [Cytobacillus firmus]
MTIRSQLLKGILDACVMAIVEEQAIYGYELSQKLQKAGLPDISDGTIYPVLLRLQKNGFIRSEMRPSDSGPNRKYYFLTDNGTEELERIAKEWMLIASPVSNLLKRGENNAKHKTINQ